MLRVIQLMYFMAPAYVANMVPPFLKYWKGWNPPINRRWLGSHKTVLGFTAGVLAAVLTAAVQSHLGWSADAITVRETWLGLGVDVKGSIYEPCSNAMRRRSSRVPGNISRRGR